MSAETLARWQFGITTVYHFLFVPITIALSLLVAVMQTIWYRSGDEKMLRLTKFFGKLFLINFAMGVVTGIVQEFQFGMNWSEYSRFVGDIFGAPLAMEALIAFFMESVFLGMWIFGWDRLPKKLHLMSIWLGAIGTMISAIFILAANSWMQNPTGSVFAGGRAQMVNLGEVLTNPVNLVTLPHVLAGAYLTAGGLILGIAGWHLVKNAKAADTDKAAADGDAWRWATRFGAWVMIVAGLCTFITGDLQGKVMTTVQPMKMAAAEALWTTEQPASFSILTIGSLDGKIDDSSFSIKVPYVLSFLATGSFGGKVLGISDLVDQAKSGTVGGANTALQTDPTVMANLKAAAANPDFDWVPNLPVTYWSFRFMMGLGFVAFAIGIWALVATRKGAIPKGGKWWTAAMIASPLLPLFANSFGWIFTEMGRQPFIVYGVLPTMSANSPGVSALEVGLTMVLYTVIYGVLAVVEVGLLLHFIKLGLPDVVEPEVITDADAPLSFAY